ncbi:MAG: hypothetical protein HYT79_04945 [Elusimicrobia bacterium]|nr:hypothetical protein [Elusimicrobiota bacterium]
MSKPCPLCNKEVDAHSLPNGGSGYIFDCPTCGRYQITRIAMDCAPNWPQETMAKLRLATRRASDNKNPLTIDSRNYEDIAGSVPQLGVQEKIELLLAEYAKRSNHPGFVFKIENGESIYPLCGAMNIKEWAYYHQALTDRRFIVASLKGEHWLTPEGWEKYEKIKAGNIASRTCFVAMSFDPSLDKNYKDGIHPAIKELKFEPLRIDRKEHNNRIDDEIIAGIRQCRFMVADFTGQRGGVYFEAGFAEGLGRQVIRCCQSDEKDNLHFDVNHYSFIFWDSSQDLKEKLKNRIAATVVN